MNNETSKEYLEQGEKGLVQSRLEIGKEALQEILERMGQKCEIVANEGVDELRFNIIGENIELIIGKKGQTLDALQFIVGKIISRVPGPRKAVIVDSGGYRERRASSLMQLAHRLGEEVLQTGQAVALNSMSAQDRRIIHMALKDMQGVSTHSEGEGENRRLFIIHESELRVSEN